MVLDRILAEKRSSSMPDMKEDAYFELFSFEQIFKNHDTDYDDFDHGRVGGSGDGGIDGFFFFINDDLIEEDADLAEYRKNLIFDVYVIQATREHAFAEDVLNKFIVTTSDVFNMNKDHANLIHQYNERLVDKVILFRESYLKLATAHHSLRIHFVYSCKGEKDRVSPAFSRRIEILKETVSSLFAGVSSEVTLLGARELLELNRMEKSYTLKLKFYENYLSKAAGDTTNYVVLSSLADFFEFVADENKNLRRHIFDYNIRDFQGSNVEVNKEILNTLATEQELDFWWLNNGITILASAITIVGKTINMENVQVINGLQTTTCIFNYMKDRIDRDLEYSGRDKSGSILIKIINITDPQARDKIIRATNFQTAVAPASFKALEPIHRNLEDFFKSHDWYYDRRKNYYRNTGKPADRIVSIQMMAQSTMAILFREPQTARARPTSIVKMSNVIVFDDNISPSVYLLIAQTARAVEKFLRRDIDDFTYQEKTNFRFHIAMALMCKILGRVDYTSKELDHLGPECITEERIAEATRFTLKAAREYSSSHSVSIEKMAKAKPFVESLKGLLETSGA